jgi:mono/diheme cytochrome c family protein
MSIELTLEGREKLDKSGGIKSKRNLKQMLLTKSKLMLMTAVIPSVLIVGCAETIERTPTATPTATATPLVPSTPTPTSTPNPLTNPKPGTTPAPTAGITPQPTSTTIPAPSPTTVPPLSATVAASPVPAPTATVSTLVITPTPAPIPQPTATTPPPSPTATPVEPTATPQPIIDQAKADAGGLLYASNCSGCHSRGPDKVVGPGHENVYETAKSRVEGLTPEEYLSQSITDSKAFVVSGFSPIMPSFTSFSDEQILALIEYLKTL